MQVLAIGLNHNTAPIEVREKLALGDWQIKEALISLRDHVPEGIILSTCNRTEVYTLADEQLSEAGNVESFLCELGDMPLDELSPYLYRFHSDEAVSHLFRIASGLESMIVGEFEVLGQVRQALADVENSGFVSLPLLNLFRQAVRVGRLARRETGISRNPVSISSVGVELARKIFDNFSDCRVLVISAGEASKLAVEALARYGIHQITVASRSYEKALDLASAHGGKAVPFHHLQEPLADVDIVIGASGAPHFILEPSDVSEAMQLRAHRPLVLIDLAMPRDFDPRIKGIENVHLHDIDDLKSVSGSNKKQREKEIQKVTGIIDEEVARFMSWWQSFKAVPTITALVDKAEKIRRSQLNSTLRKMQVTAEERTALDAMTQAIVKKILHEPISYLRNGDHGPGKIQTAREIFGLDKKT